MSHSASQRLDSTPGKHLLVTAGPTHEPIDSVRYLANRSSGRLGIAVAQEAVNRGWHVTILLGPTHLDPETHSHLKVARFLTAADLQRLLHEHWPRHDLLIMAAAVADYRPRLEPRGQRSDDRRQPLAASRDQPDRSQSKIPRTAQSLTLELEPTPDLLAELASFTRPEQRVVGFALEPADRLLKSARSKLIRKRLDAIVANQLETMDAPSMPAGATVILRDGREIQLPPSTKQEFARQLLGVLEDELRLPHGRLRANAGPKAGP